MDPIQGRFGPTARLWRGTAGGKKLLDGSGKFVLKGGSQVVTLIEELPLPMLTTEQRVQVAIRVAQHVVGSRCPKWSAWAEAWLAGQDRTTTAAQTAAATEAAWAVKAAAAVKAATAATTVAQMAEATRMAERTTLMAGWANEEAAEAAQAAAAEATVLPNLVLLLQDVVKQGEQK